MLWQNKLSYVGVCSDIIHRCETNLKKLFKYTNTLAYLAAASVTKKTHFQWHLDEVTADQVEASAASDNFQRLNGRDSADFRRSSSRARGRINGVDVEGQIDRNFRISELSPDFWHERFKGFVPKLFDLWKRDELVRFDLTQLQGVIS